MLKFPEIRDYIVKAKHNHISTTCGVFPGYRTSRVLKVQLVAEVQVVVPGFIHQVATTQATFDHLVLGHCSSQELYREQREAHLKERAAYALAVKVTVNLYVTLISHTVM